MKITKKQLRKLIAESFVGAPDGKVYTQRTKKAHSEYGEVMGDGSADEMDVPVVYGEDRTKVATPKLYGVLTRNLYKIHNFHEKGPKLYKILMNPETDPENKKYFLYQLNIYDIVTDKELEDISLEIDLLADPDFQDFRTQSAERLEKKHHAEVFPEEVKQRELYRNNPQIIAQAKKKIDKSIDGALEYFKDIIKEDFFNSMYDYKEKGHKPSKIGFNPDEGMEPSEMAIHIAYGGVLEESEVFEKSYDATLYNDDLYQYRSKKAINLALTAIDALVEAGILEKTADGKVRMSERSYQIDLNNMRGRKEDFYKQSGTRSAFLDDPYKPNPNLPVITKEGKMKLTRRQLRKLIAEAIDESRRYIDNPDGDLTRADRAYQSADQKDMHAASLHPKLPVLIKSPDIETRVQGRELAGSLDDIDRLTPEEETAIDHMGYHSAFEADKGLEQVIDKEALYGAMKSRSKVALRYFGFTYIEDIPHLVPETDYEDHGDTFRFQAQVLGCDIEDMAFVDSEESYKTQLVIYDMIRAMKPPQIPIPEDDGYYGNNKLYDLGGFKVLFTGHMGGYYTITICGK